ncbi:MAG: hypothetical protein J0H01_30250 [Rhizobiales bacterium]|nr:hypothetical protein [Hyphomicrobiales bacterium]
MFFAVDAEAQSDAERRQSVQADINRATDCITQRVRTHSGFRAAVLAGDISDLLGEALRPCAEHILAMSAAHDRNFGGGTGRAFVMGDFNERLDADVRARLKPQIDRILASRGQQPRQQQLTAESNRARAAAYECAYREAARMLRTNETAEAVAKAAVLLCQVQVQIAVRAIGRAVGLNTVTPRMEREMDTIMRDQVMAQVIARRGDLANQSANPPPPQAATAGRNADDPSLARSRPLVAPLETCLRSAVQGTTTGRMVARDAALTTAIDICRSEIEALGRALFVDRAKPTLDEGRVTALEFAKRLTGEILDR